MGAMRPIVLTVAGSDPTGGAGAQADLRTIEACGGWPVSVLAAITAQSTRGVLRIAVLDADLVAAQLDVLLDDVTPGAVKTGMLGQAAVVRVLAERIRERGLGPFVCDPVLASGGGVPLLEAGAIETLIEELGPLATVLTPNVPEVAALAGLEVDDLEGAERAARRILSRGVRAVLVKGGHLSEHRATDLLVVPTGSVRFVSEHVEPGEAHGTGCVFSAALATYLAHGLELERAIREAKRVVALALRHGVSLGHGARVADPLHRRHGERAEA